MAIPRLNNCCCGCSLRTGSLIIGILEAIFVSLYLIAAIILCTYLANKSNFPGLTNDERSILYGLYIFVSIVSSIQLLFTIMLLIGINYEKPKLMRPWLIFAVINIVQLIVVAVLNSIASGFGGIAGSVLGSILSIALNLYFILVVYNYYLNLLNAGLVHPNIHPPPYAPYNMA